jgi:alkylation response protein AidB-like acyl-CoA dehydrogenase
MSIAISDDHRALADTASDLLRTRDARGAARALLTAATEEQPALWKDIVELGWLGLHVPEAQAGSGYGLEELVIVVEEMGRALAPGAFVPTVIASAVLVAAGDTAIVPGLADGSRTASIALTPSIEVRDGKAYGTSGTAVSGGLADVLVTTAGDDVIVVELAGADVTVPTNLDPTRRSARITLDGQAATVFAGQAQSFVDYARMILAAEAVGVARECTTMAAEYAKVREQFGRPIAMYQAVKHHCANMVVATELATSAVWDAARAASTGGDQLSYAAAIAASLAGPAADLCANLNMQVHGGIGFTWEQDCHVFMRRATTLRSLLDFGAAASDTVDLNRKGVRRSTTDIQLPAEADQYRAEIKALADRIKGLDAAAQRDALIETGYVMPHWPKPWGRAAGPIEQLVIEQEIKAGGVTKPGYGITGWVILTLIQYGNDDQVKRWVPSALNQEVIWCQLFSEPDAGSDAAGIKTKATRVDGGWLVNGQKVWTSGAHVAGMGFATVRTNPDVPKHDGITTMVIDMHAEGVEVRPLKMTTGASEFNEVFFNDVFVPDDDVVGSIDSGWTVARATLGNESVSIGGGQGGMATPGEMLLAAFDKHPERLAGGVSRIGRYIAQQQAMGLLNLRSVYRAVEGAGPGPEGAMTKLILSEIGHDAAAILSELAGQDTAFMDGDAAMSNMLVLFHRGMSIAGGTSEIKRTQIGERILGLPRDPLIK